MTPEGEKKLDKIYEVLMGDPLTGKAGYFHTHNRIVEDLYGEKPDGTLIDGKKNTLFRRVSRLEETGKKQWYTLTGICAALLAIKFGILNLIKSAFEK